MSWQELTMSKGGESRRSHLEKYYWMLAGVFHKQILKIRRASGQNHFVAFQRSSFHSQSDVTESLDLREQGDVGCWHNAPFYPPAVTGQKHSVSWIDDYSISDKTVDRPFSLILSNLFLHFSFPWVPAFKKVICCLPSHIVYVRLLEMKYQLI